MEKEIFKQINEIDLNGKKSVFIRSWDQDEVEVRYPVGKDCFFRLNNEILNIDASSYCIISIPETTKIFVKRINGNLETVGQIQFISIENVGGNCSIQAVDGLNVENITGNLKLGRVGSQSSIRNIGGNFTFRGDDVVLDIHAVGGNLSGEAKGLELQTRVGGNIKLKIGHFEGKRNELRAGGAIKIRVEDLENSTSIARAGGIVTYRYKDDDEKSLNGKLEKQIGSGETQIRLKAGGNINISDQSNDFEIVQNFGDNSDSYLEEIERKFESRSIQSSGFDFSDLFEIEDKINSNIKDKTGKIEEKIQKAMEKMERKFTFREEFGIPPRPPRPSRPMNETAAKSEKEPSVSSEEKLMILKMLQDKKISVEEAERLLKAVEKFG